MVASIDNVVVHPQYMATEEEAIHDVALIKLPAPVEYSDAIRPICLPKEGVRFDNRDNTILVITGWGVKNSLFIDNM